MCTISTRGEVHTKLPWCAEAVCLKCVHCHFAVCYFFMWIYVNINVNVNMSIRNSRKKRHEKSLWKKQHCISIVIIFMFVCVIKIYCEKTLDVFGCIYFLLKAFLIRVSLWTHSLLISCSTNIMQLDHSFISTLSLSPHASIQLNSHYRIWVQRFLAWWTFLRHKSPQVPMNQIPESSEQMACLREREA